MKKKGRLTLILSIAIGLVAVLTASMSTFAWFQLRYQNVATYNSATIQSTDSNLKISITNYFTGAISAKTEADGLNRWDLTFSGYLDDRSYNGLKNQPLYKMSWTTVGVTASGATKVGIDSYDGFYIFQVQFENDSRTNDIYVYLGGNSSLTKADSGTASTNAELCERIAIRRTAGDTISYWVPNRSSGVARMLGSSSWTDATKAYGLNSIYIGAPEKANSPVNTNKPSDSDWTAAGVSNVVHYGNFGSISESSTSCGDGQFICKVGHGANAADHTYKVNVVMWVEGTDAACTSAALSGVTNLNLEFVALSKQLWPSAS